MASWFGTISKTIATISIGRPNLSKVVGILAIGLGIQFAAGSAGLVAIDAVHVARFGAPSTDLVTETRTRFDSILSDQVSRFDGRRQIHGDIGDSVLPFQMDACRLSLESLSSEDDMC